MLIYKKKKKKNKEYTLESYKKFRLDLPLEKTIIKGAKTVLFEAFVRELIVVSKLSSGLFVYILEQATSYSLEQFSWRVADLSASRLAESVRIHQANERQRGGEYCGFSRTLYGYKLKWQETDQEAAFDVPVSFVLQERSLYQGLPAGRYLSTVKLRYPSLLIITIWSHRFFDSLFIHYSYFFIHYYVF